MSPYVAFRFLAALAATADAAAATAPHSALLRRPTDGLTDYAAAAGAGGEDDDDAFLALMISSLCQSLIGTLRGESLSLSISIWSLRER